MAPGLPWRDRRKRENGGRRLVSPIRRSKRHPLGRPRASCARRCSRLARLAGRHRRRSAGARSLRRARARWPSRRSPRGVARAVLVERDRRGARRDRAPKRGGTPDRRRSPANVVRGDAAAFVTGPAPAEAPFDLVLADPPLRRPRRRDRRGSSTLSGSPGWLFTRRDTGHRAAPWEPGSPWKRGSERAGNAASAIRSSSSPRRLTRRP